MATAAQHRAFGKGLAATVQRTKERATTTITIQHDPKWQGQQLLTGVKHALMVHGGLNAATTTIELDDGSENLKTALTKYEAEVQELRRQLNAALRAQHVAPTSESQRWIPVVRAAEILGVHKQQIYRAIDDVRIAFQGDRGRRKSNLRVDPSTYRPKVRTVAAPRTRKSK